MNTASTSGTGSLPSNTIANPKGELKAITTRSGLVLDGPSVPMPPPFINPEEDERVEETLMDPKHGENDSRDDDEKIDLEYENDTSRYSNTPQKESINMIDIYNISHKEYLEDLFANEKITNHPSGNPTSSLTSHINPLSGNPTPISKPVTKSSSPTLTSIEESDLIWEEFKAYLASDSFPPGIENTSSPLPPFQIL
ncbi:hypothetical protein Tco_0735086 [Tanacetum coccineum]